MSQNQLTLDAASEAQRLVSFMQQYPIEWKGSTRLVAMPHTGTKVQYEVVVVGSGMAGVYELAEALYGELILDCGPVAHAKDRPANRYYTTLTRRISRVGRRKPTVSDWGYVGIDGDMDKAIANLPYTRCGQYSQQA